MNSIKKIATLMLALVCIFSFAACSGNDANPENPEGTSSLKLEDGEDMGIEQKKIKVANLTGKDAVEMLMRLEGSGEWSLNILSQEFFHTNKAVEVTYGVKESSVYDIRLVFEDGTYQDFTKLDFAAANEYVYLNAPANEASTAQ